MASFVAIAGLLERLGSPNKTFNYVFVVSSADMVDRDDLRQQFVEAFEGAEYPVNSPMDLLPALPQGPGTKFEAGEFSVTAMELNAKASGNQEFPYDSVEELVDDLMNGLEDADLL